VARRAGAAWGRSGGRRKHRAAHAADIWEPTVIWLRRDYKAYEAACKREAVRPGRMFVYETGHLMSPRFIINFPTKRHWRDKSRIEEIESGLADLAKVIRDLGLRSIAIPPLGCGLGGLSWNEVRPRIERALADLADVQVVVFEPNGAPASDKLSHIREVPKSC